MTRRHLICGMLFKFLLIIGIFTPIQLQKLQDELCNKDTAEGYSNWSTLGGNLKQLDISPLGSVWGVNNHDDVYILNGKNWRNVRGSLKHVSSGESGVWGVNSFNDTYYRNGVTHSNPAGTSWTSVRGDIDLVQIDSGPFGIVYGVDKSDQIYCRNGITRSNPTGTAWTHLTYGKLKYVSCGPKRCWGVRSARDNMIWVRQGVTPTNCMGDHWILIRGKLKQLEVGPGGNVSGVTSNGTLFTREGITALKPTGSSWRMIPNVNFEHVSVGFTKIFALDKGGAIFYFEGAKHVEGTTSTTPTEGCRISQQLKNFLKSLLNGEISTVYASKKLAELTSDSSGFEAHDVNLTTLALENIVNNTVYLNKTGPSIVKTVNNILNVEANVIGKSERDDRSAQRILFVIEKYLENVPIKPGSNISQNEENLAIQAQDWNVTNFQGVQVVSQAYLKDGKKQSSFIVSENDTTDHQPNNSKISLKMPKTLFETLESKSEEQRLSFAVLRKTSLFQSPGRSYPHSNESTQRNVNSFVIAASVKGLEVNKLTEPVESAYQPLREGNDEITECVFWDFKLKNGQGDWSGEGCYYKGTINGLVNCHCYHLTNFAILTDIYIDDRNDDIHDHALSIISYVGCAVSLFSLLLTIITLLVFKDLRSKAPTQTLLNFCIALSLTLVVFLAAAERSKTSSMAGCRAAAVALHYLVLVVFIWMAIQAFNMFMAFVIVLHRHYSHFMLKCCIAGWGLPGIIVIITAATSIDSYGDEHFCRVKGLAFFAGFLAPVLAILVGNTIAFVAIFRSLLASGTEVTADRKVSGLKQAKRAAAILSVLGLTWLFGLLAVNDAKLVFQYLFCIFNSIQGLLVFLFYCALSAETRAKYRILLFGESVQSSHELQHETPTRTLLPRTSIPNDAQ